MITIDKTTTLSTIEKECKKFGIYTIRVLRHYNGLATVELYNLYYKFDGKDKDLVTAVNNAIISMYQNDLHCIDCPMTNSPRSDTDKCNCDEIYQAMGIIRDTPAGK